MPQEYKLFEGLKILKEPIYNNENLRFGKRLGVYHPLNNEIYLLEKKEWELIKDLKRGHSISEADILENFADLNIALNKNEKLKITLDYKPDDAQMYIKLTEACNFACPGCTTSIDRIPINKAKVLDLPTLELFIESFVRSAHEKNMKFVKIKWAGGEPLLNNSYQLIEQSQPKIFELKKKYPDISINQIVLSNGVFINASKILFFKEAGITLSVSLWGTGKVQDNARKPRNQMEIYEPIINNISSLEKEGIDYSINYVLTPTNAHNFKDFIESVWDIDSPNFIGKDWEYKHPVKLFIAFFRPQTGISKKTSKIMYKMMLTGLRLGFGKIKDLIERQIPIQGLCIIDYLNLTGIAPYTCGSGINYVAVGADGAAACHEELFGMQSNMQAVKEGKNIIDLVNEKHKKYLKYYNGLNYMEYTPEKFDYLLLHGGLGCPRLRTAEDDKNWKTNLGTTAAFYNSFVPELLALECMRLRTINRDV